MTTEATTPHERLAAFMARPVTDATRAEAAIVDAHLFGSRPETPEPLHTILQGTIRDVARANGLVLNEAIFKSLAGMLIGGIVIGYGFREAEYQRAIWEEEA